MTRRLNCEYHWNILRTTITIRVSGSDDLISEGCRLEILNSLVGIISISSIGSKIIRITATATRLDAATVVNTPLSEMIHQDSPLECRVRDNQLRALRKPTESWFAKFSSRRVFEQGASTMQLLVRLLDSQETNPSQSFPAYPLAGGVCVLEHQLGAISSHTAVLLSGR